MSSNRFQYSPNKIETDEFNEKLREQMAIRNQAMRMNSAGYMGYKAGKMMSMGVNPVGSMPQQRVVGNMQPKPQMYRQGGFVYVPVPESYLEENPFGDDMGYAQEGQQYTMEQTRGEAGFINNLVNMAKRRQIVRNNPDWTAQQVGEEMRRVGNFKNYNWSPVYGSMQQPAAQAQEGPVVTVKDGIRTVTYPDGTSFSDPVSIVDDHSGDTEVEEQIPAVAQQSQATSAPAAAATAATVPSAPATQRRTVTGTTNPTQPASNANDENAMAKAQADAAKLALDAAKLTYGNNPAQQTSVPEFNHNIVYKSQITNTGRGPWTPEPTQDQVVDYLKKNPSAVYQGTDSNIYFIDNNGLYRKTKKSNYDWAKDNNVSIQEWQRQRDQGVNPADAAKPQQTMRFTQYTKRDEYLRNHPGEVVEFVDMGGNATKWTTDANGKIVRAE